MSSIAVAGLLDYCSHRTGGDYMRKITKADIDQFKAIVKSDTGKEITDEEAREAIIWLVNFQSFLLKKHIGRVLSESDFEDFDMDAWKKDLPKPFKLT